MDGTALVLPPSLPPTPTTLRYISKYTHTNSPTHPHATMAGNRPALTDRLQPAAYPRLGESQWYIIPQLIISLKPLSLTDACSQM